MTSLYGAGDCIQQGLEHQRFHKGEPYRHDWMRTTRMCSVGAIMGPFNHYWYVWLDRRIPAAKQFKYVFQKVLLDQSLFAPFCTVSFFVLFNKFEGHNTAHIKKELKEKFLFTYLVDCAIFPAAQTINFFFVPSHLRVLYVSTLVLFWNVFLSHMKHYDVINQPDEATAMMVEDAKETAVDEKKHLEATQTPPQPQS